MNIKVNKVSLHEIQPLRALFLNENNFQIRYNASHERGWTDSYVFIERDVKIGYGSIKGNEDRRDRETIFEFYLIPSFRNIALQVFEELLKVSKASLIECQSNDHLLTSLLYQYGRNINAHVVLFQDNVKSDIGSGNFIFRARVESDTIFKHLSEPIGDYVIELGNEVVATGGFLLHYNMPFADLYMEVKESHRRQGVGSFLIQELKRQCYISGRVPAARCDIENFASRATLIKAGFRVAGFMLSGRVKS